MDTREELKNLVVASQADLHRMWELVVNPLGFSRHSVWVTFIDADGRLVPQITELPDTPDPVPESLADSFVEVFGQLLEQVAPGGSLALLLSRPGHQGTDTSDRAVGRTFHAAAERAGVRLAPIHLATDAEILAVTPDDLAA